MGISVVSTNIEKPLKNQAKKEFETKKFNKNYLYLNFIFIKNTNLSQNCVFEIILYVMRY